MEQNSKWLIVFFKNITVVQWFFIGMGAITLLFVRLMMNHYEQSNVSKFRKDSGSARTKTTSLAVKAPGSKNIEKKP